MMTMNKNLLIFFIFVIPLINFIFATPVLLSDQGTDLKLVSTGELLSTGNITIYIYDSVTGGSLIYSNLFINNITNGSWNVVINPNLEYGKNYWKDYSVNGDNLNFSGNDRIQFQSPLGLINNASLFNFSLINSCVAGSSIRQVYENGSVLCETDDTGSGGNSSWNESYANTKYLLQSEEGNLDVNSSVYSNSSTWWSGLSSWLSGWFINNAGVLEFNETKLNNTIDSRASGLGDNSSWNQSLANSLYILQSTEGNLDVNSSVYSNSTTWWSGLTSWLSGWFINNAGVLEFNETKLNNTIDLRAGGDNTSWNESYANTQYADISVVDTQKNASGNYVYNDSTTIYFNETKLNNTIDLRAGGDNSSWNESYANTQYASISEPLWSANFTAYNSSWSSTFNSTYDGYNSTELIKDWNSTGYIKNWNNTGLIINWSTSLTNDNTSWNESYADTQYSSISEPLWSANFTAYNSSWSSTFNSTYDGYNSTGLIKDWNSTGYIKNWNNTGLIINWSTSLTNDNTSWNESYANTRYLLQSEEGNLDVNSSVYSNSSTWWSGLYSYLSGWFVNNAGVLEFNETKLNNTIDLRAGGDNTSWNESYADTQYSSISEPLWSANFTAYNSSWSSTFNSTYDGYNSTGLIKDWNSTGYIKNWNNTGLIINWSTSLTNDNTSWNESYANTRYLLQSEEGNLDVNSSVYSNSSTWWSGLYSYLSGWFVNNAGVLEFNETKLNNTIDLRAGGDNSSWNESYANTKYLQNGTSVRFTDVNSTGNITTEEIHFENDIVNHRIYDNSTCVIINGDTSTMYIF